MMKCNGKHAMWMMQCNDAMQWETCNVNDEPTDSKWVTQNLHVRQGVVYYSRGMFNLELNTIWSPSSFLKQW